MIVEPPSLKGLGNSSALTQAANFLADGLYDQPIEDDPNREEWLRCKDDPAYFITTYCKIQDSVTRNWIDFDLWPAQVEALLALDLYQLIAWLKSRQVGASWVVLAYGLWDMIFHAIATVLIFSRRETEAKYLLSEFRLRGMFHQLPEWMKPMVTRNDTNLFALSNGSTARAFPTGVGDSYTATVAIIDEADLVPDLDVMLASIKPTIDAGGKLFLVGRVNKREPNSAFKQIYRRAKLGQNAYHALFLGWDSHPNRDQAWYEQQKRDLLTQDDLWEQYPETDEQALARGHVGRVYPLFDSRNITKDAEYPGGDTRILFSCDDGYTDRRAIGLWWIGYAQGKPDRICLFDEVVETEELHLASLRRALIKAGVPLDENETFEQIAVILNQEKYRYLDLAYYDPSAAAAKAEAEMAGISVWGAFNGVAEGIKVVRRMICDGNQERRMLVHPRCVYTIESLSNYSTKEESTTGDDPKPIHDIYSHCADMVRYLIATRFMYD